MQHNGGKFIVFKLFSHIQKKIIALFLNNMYKLIGYRNIFTKVRISIVELNKFFLLEVC